LKAAYTLILVGWLSS